MQFTIHWSGQHRGFKKSVIGAEERGLSGVYENGKPYGPNCADTIAAVPYRWRKAVKASLGWWYREPGLRGKPVFVMTVYSTRGRALTTLYAIPNAQA